MTLEQLMACTGSTREHATKFLGPIEDAMGLYEITEPRVVAGFLSQIGHESSNLSVLTENLNYRAAALLTMFSRQRISVEDANRYGRTTEQAAQPEEIANRIYGGDWGAKNLGNTEPGDGWKYRGRGLKQLTGRSNYRACGEALGLNLIEDPDQLTQPLPAALSAAWFWASRRRLSIDDAAQQGDVRKMTKLINGGDLGLAQREVLYTAALRALEVA